MTPEQIENAERAKQALGISVIPNDWWALLRARWEIKPTSCRCGGQWAWVSPDCVMHGCVCHQTPVLA